VLEVVGSDPLAVYRVALTPEPPALSAAGNWIVTGAGRSPVGQAAPLQVIEVVGAVESTSTAWVRTASTFPALSQARNLIVVGWEMVNEPVYCALEVVGSEPFVV
jgi:hypothetical protein